MSKKRLYIIPELYTPTSGALPELNGIVWAAGDDEPRCYTHLEDNPAGAQDDSNEAFKRTLLHETNAIVCPETDSAMEALAIVKASFAATDDADYCYRKRAYVAVEELEPIRDRAPLFGLPTYLRGVALALDIPYPESNYREAEYFRHPAPNGRRHKPEEDFSRWAAVLLHDMEALEAMRTADKRIDAMEREYYNLYERGNVGTTNTKGFAFDRDRVVARHIWCASHAAHPYTAGPKLKSGVSVRADCLTEADRLQHFIRRSVYAPCGIECPREQVFGGEKGKTLTVRDATDAEGDRVFVYFTLALPFVPVPAENWQRELKNKVYKVVRKGVTIAKEQGPLLPGRCPTTGYEELNGLPIRYDRAGDYLEIRPSGYFHLLWRRPRIVDGELQAYYQAAEGEELKTQPLTLRTMVERLISTYRYIQIAKKLQWTHLELNVCGIYDVTDTELYLMAYRDEAFRIFKDRYGEELGIKVLNPE